MKFKSYTEIENSYNSKFISHIREHEYDKSEIEWVATIKWDGSNFQCCINSEDKFIVGKRTAYLGRGDVFQGYERAMRNMNVETNLRKMKDIIKSDFNIFCKFGLRVFGELCGGYYRHPAVEKVKGAVKIQGRVDYHPDNIWLPFDIELVDSEDNIIKVFSQDEVFKYCTAVNLPHPIIVKRGTFDEVLNTPNDFIDTTGNILFNLPLIEKNITEGIVIKPNIPLRFGNGSRVMVKSKNEKFKERMNKAPKAPKEIIPMNELEKKYFEIYREFITESRLMSVFSKVGKVDTKAFGQIMGLFIKDLYNDFDKEYAEEIKQLEDTLSVDEFNLAKTKKELSKEIAEFIRPIFLKYLDE